MKCTTQIYDNEAAILALTQAVGRRSDLSFVLLFRVQDGSEAASVGPPSPDQQSYDADGSDEGDDSTTLHEDNDESKHGSNNTLRGSTESLYYSAWSLQDISGPSDKDLAKDGSPRPALTETETIESMMEASVDKLTSEKEEMNENSPSAGEIKREMPQDSAEYKPFNSRFSWSAEIGNRLAAIWGGGKETTEPVVLVTLHLI